MCTNHGFDFTSKQLKKWHKFSKPIKTCYDNKTNTSVNFLLYLKLKNNSDNENDVLFQKVTQAYSEKNPSAPIRSRT